jgi:hypothetical protein
MLTVAASATLDVPDSAKVRSRAVLAAQAVTPSQLRARIAAGRWRLCGKAVVLHNGPLTRRQRWDAALINAGPRSALTAFTAAEIHGLRGWARDDVQVLVPLNASTPPGRPELRIRLHRTRHWHWSSDPIARRCHLLAPALVIAAASFDNVRPACGILAAAVQQRLVTTAHLVTALEQATRVKHRSLLLAAVHDIAGGAQALSEIDSVRLCRRNRLPAPIQQAVRSDSTGRRRYLDASWRRRDGRLVVAEVAGAIHLSPKRWCDDPLRQNELVLGDALVLRYPTVVVRAEQPIVAAQLRRALWL